MKTLKKSIYIDALALAQAQKSGVGLTLEQTLNSLVKLKGIRAYRVYLVVPLGKAKYLRSYASATVHIKIVYVPARILAMLMKLKLLLPVDWFLGSGVYVFPNYRNWPLWHSRSLTYIYDTVFLQHPETVQPKNQRYLSRHIHQWIGRTDQVVTISEQVKGEIEKLLGVHYSHIDIVPCGVDRRIFYKRAGREVQAVKQRYDIPFEHYVLYVGNIEPRKNLLTLLDAYEQLPTALRRQYGLVFVGAGGWLNKGFLERLETMQRQGFNVMKVAQYVSALDLPAIYSGASLLVHPALYEGFGMTPLEAMACETPVAVSGLPAIREVVQAAGQYFDPLSVQSMAAAIQKALQATDTSPGRVREGLARARRLSWDSSAQSLLTVIDSERSKGPHRHPLLVRLQSLYRRIDRGFRSLLGDRAFRAYRPPRATTTAELRQYIYNDFFKEQPSYAQVLTLRIYLGTKHLLIQAVRRMYHLLQPKP